MSVPFILSGVVAVALLAYLVYSVIFPENF